MHGSTSQDETGSNLFYSQTEYSATRMSLCDQIGPLWSLQYRDINWCSSDAVPAIFHSVCTLWPDATWNNIGSPSLLPAVAFSVASPTPPGFAYLSIYNRDRFDWKAWASLGRYDNTSAVTILVTLWTAVGVAVTVFRCSVRSLLRFHGYTCTIPFTLQVASCAVWGIFYTTPVSPREQQWWHAIWGSCCSRGPRRAASTYRVPNIALGKYAHTLGDVIENRTRGRTLDTMF